MASDLKSKKSDLLSRIVTSANDAGTLLHDFSEIKAFFDDNGFAAGGANAIVDGDCMGTNSHLSADLINGFMVAMEALVKASFGVKEMAAIRQVSSKSA